MCRKAGTYQTSGGAEQYHYMSGTAESIAGRRECREMGFGREEM